MKRTKIRPTLGDNVDLRLLQLLSSIQELSPGVNDMLFFAGKRGGSFYYEKHSGLSFDQALDKYVQFNRDMNLGIPEIVSSDDKHAILRVKECALAYGRNEGQNVCWFEAGIQTGMLSTLTGKHIISREIACCANGSPYCEFEISEEPLEQHFEEAWKET